VKKKNSEAAANYNFYGASGGWSGFREAVRGAGEAAGGRTMTGRQWP